MTCRQHQQIISVLVTGPVIKASCAVRKGFGQPYVLFADRAAVFIPGWSDRCLWQLQEKPGKVRRLFLIVLSCQSAAQRAFQLVDFGLTFWEN